jgi:aspartate/methionine/tyrosine aminotransferase
LTQPDLRNELWRRQEYTVIGPAWLSDQLAQVALRPEKRAGILGRTRAYIRRGYPVLEEWLRGHGQEFSLTPPQAAAIAFVRYGLEVNSTELVDRLLREKSLLIVPGDQFGLDHYLRISFGLPHEYLLGGLGRLGEMVEEIQG